MLLYFLCRVAIAAIVTGVGQQFVTIMPCYSPLDDGSCRIGINTDKCKTFRAANTFAFNENFLTRSNKAVQMFIISRIPGSP